MFGKRKENFNDPENQSENQHQQQVPLHVTGNPYDADDVVQNPNTAALLRCNRCEPMFFSEEMSYSSYLRSEPRNLSGGYFSPFAAIFLSAIASRSISALSAKRMRYSRMSASSSSTRARIEGSVT